MKSTFSTARAIVLALICAVALSTGAQTRKSKRTESLPSPWGFTHVAINKTIGDNDARNDILIHKSPSASSPVLCEIRDNRPPEFSHCEWLTPKQAGKLGEKFDEYVSFGSSPIFAQSGDWLKVTYYSYGNHFGWVKKSDCRIVPVDPITPEELRREGCYVVESGAYKNYVIEYMTDGIEDDYTPDEIFSIGRLIDGKFVNESYVTLSACQKCFGKDNFVFDPEERTFAIHHFSDAAMKRLIAHSKKPYWWPSVNYSYEGGRTLYLFYNP